MYDEEIEKAILYYIIFDKADYIIQEDYFMNERNRKLAKSIIDLRKRKLDVSMISVKNNIKANQNQVLEYISTIGDNIYGSNPDELFNKLVELYQKRQMFELAHKILQDIETEDIDIYSQKVVKQINDIIREEKQEMTFSEQIVNAMTQIENNYNNRNDKSLYTDISDLDNKICGLHNQELTIIGARPRHR